MKNFGAQLAAVVETITWKIYMVMMMMTIDHENTIIDRSINSMVSKRKMKSTLCLTLNQSLATTATTEMI